MARVLTSSRHVQTTAGPLDCRCSRTEAPGCSSRFVCRRRAWCSGPLWRILRERKIGLVTRLGFFFVFLSIMTGFFMVFRISYDRIFHTLERNVWVKNKIWWFGVLLSSALILFHFTLWILPEEQRSISISRELLNVLFVVPGIMRPSRWHSEVMEIQNREGLEENVGSVLFASKNLYRSTKFKSRWK